MRNAPVADFDSVESEVGVNTRVARLFHPA